MLAACCLIIQQITTLLNSKHTQALISNNAKLGLLAEASQQDGRSMLNISKDMKNDSSTMKFVAIMTVIYVPGTFAAVK